jgi:glyceraldehyde 3-phosphate dehydrogenase
MPELAGRMDGLAIRVPTPNVSLVDLTCELEKETTAEEVNAALKAASENSLKGILQYIDTPLVSIDFTSSPYSAILDAPLTNMIDGKMLKVMVWYDNESGFSNRMVDLINCIGAKL